MCTTPQHELSARILRVIGQRVPCRLRSEQLHGGPEQIVLALEMAEERDFVHVSFLGDTPRGGPTGPRFGEHFDGSPKEGLSYVHAATLAGRPACVQVVTYLHHRQSAANIPTVTREFDGLFPQFTSDDLT